MLQELQKSMSQNQRLEVTVWDPNKDDIEYNFHSYIMELEDGYFMVAPPGSNIENIAPLIQPGLLVGIVLDSNPAPYIFYPTVHGKQDNPKPGYWLKLTQSTQVEQVQRRKHVRIPMHVAFKLEVLIGSHRLSVDAMTEDVSGGGMRFTTAHQFLNGQLVEAHLRFNSEQPLLKLKGKIVFCTENRLRRRRDDMYIAACQFYDLDPPQETVLVRECFRRELGLKR